jgi:hypothetical protein
MIRLQLLYNFLKKKKKKTIDYLGPTCMKTDPIISLKKSLFVVQKLCQELYNNHFSIK